MEPKSGVGDSAGATLGPEVGLVSGPAPALCGVDFGPGSLTFHSLKEMQIDGKFSTHGEGHRSRATTHKIDRTRHFDSKYRVITPRWSANRKLSRNASAVSEANRRDRFGWLGPQEFAFDTAV
jgi:hypothetical protein